MSPTSLQNVRLAIGLVQGLFLYLLYEAATSKVWPATDGPLFAALMTMGFFVPLVAIAGLGKLPRPKFLIWILVAAVFCAGVGFYDVFRMPFQTYGSDVPRAVPYFGAAALAGMLLIAHTLIVAAEDDQRLRASYPTHFDLAWKHGLQIALAVLFVGALWLLLLLGAELFRLLKIDFVKKLLEKPLFWIPVTAVGAAYALQLTDVRSDIVRGARTLLLILMSWLLPVIVVFVVCFLIALPFTGLEPLWNTKFATGTLLLACAALIILINASYQDGQHETAVALRYFRITGAVLLAPLVLIAAYALALRVNQYGWTPSRVVSAACVAVAAWYAVGYLYAALRTGIALRAIEGTNFSAALAIIVVALALSTPLADPLRLSVNSQLARLDAGRVSPVQFDYNFFRFQAGRYGREALQQLAGRTEGENASVTANLARQALALRDRPNLFSSTVRTPSVDVRLSNIDVVHPKGRPFPRELLEQEWKTPPRAARPPECVTTGRYVCRAAFIDLDGDGREEILLFETYGGGAFRQGNDQSWVFLGRLSNTGCDGFFHRLLETNFEAVQPEIKDIRVGSQRVRIMPNCEPQQ
jgi:hypothetical protein